MTNKPVSLGPRHLLMQVRNPPSGAEGANILATSSILP